MSQRILFIAIALLMAPPLLATDKPLTEIVVTAELISNGVMELPSSVSVIDGNKIAQRSAQHLEDLLGLTPNVNYATGASRGRFVQIRGIGERSEFQEPVIHSVGVLLDGIDLTGIAAAASTLDVQQVEVLRGPQGTLYGANALAGLINVVSNAPSREPLVKLGAGIEDYGGRELNGVVSGPVNDRSAYRLALKHYQSDGFTNNVFLDRDDTNGIDETTARLRIRSRLFENSEIDFSLFKANINNGYDAFSLDNTRQTYSDQPGVDQQDTLAAAVSISHLLSDNLQLEGVLSVADSELEYSYDEDWSHTDICDNTVCDSALFGFDWFYRSFDDYRRDNDNTSLDLRINNTRGERHGWVAGLYMRDQTVTLQRQYTFAEADFASRLDTQNTAVYGQWDWQIASRWSLSSGLRLERREVKYQDSLNNSATPKESLWGGRLALQYHADDGGLYYGLISRGYKAGGFNLDQDIDPAQREFNTETMVNYELGYKNSLLNDRLNLQAALFYQDRDDIQSKQSIVRSIASGAIGGPCPCSFTDFTDNAASGRNRGLELELQWQASEWLSLNAIVGLLDTEFDQFLSFDHVNADRENGLPFNLKGREQAHAPGYQWVLGGTWHINPQWQLRASIEAKDAFFFSERHEEQSDVYELLNMQLTYQSEHWQVGVYAKNLTNEIVKTRGFGSFGNDPRKFYITEPYNQFAAPRVIGVKASVQY